MTCFPQYAVTELHEMLASHEDEIWPPLEMEKVN